MAAQRGARAGAVLWLSWWTACGAGPDLPDVDTAPPLELPDRLVSGDALVLLRLSEGATTTSSAAHRGLARLFTDHVSVRDVLHRGGGQLPAEADDGARVAGSAADQVGLLLERVSQRETGPIPADEAVDACGNPMVAAFVTPDVLSALLPDDSGVTFEELVSRDARGDGAGVDTLQDGTWDISLTETRRDGMVDAIVQLYPAVDDARPGLLGHVMGFFLTAAHPGFFQAPLFLAMDKVTVSISGLLQLDRIYVDPVYGDAREVYRFPHRARTVQRSDVGVTLLGDPLCDLHHADAFSATTPYGCQLEDGRSLPVQLDVGSRLGSTIHEVVLGGGTRTGPLEQVQDALAWQLAAFVACPTLSEARYVREGPVEVLVCPEGGADACLAHHDAEEAGCDVGDASVFPSPTAVSAPSSASGLPAPLITPARTPYALSPAAGGSDLVVGLDGAAGAQVTLHLDRDATVSLVRPGQSPIALTPGTNSHCGADVYTVAFDGVGRHQVRISPASPVQLLLVDVDDWVPAGVPF